MSDEEYRDATREALEEHVPPDEREPAAVESFLERLHFVSVDAKGDAGWDQLAEVLEEGKDRIRAFYLAVGPELFGTICKRLGKEGLVTPETRVIIEKPIGHDLASACKVNDAVGSVFDESQIYRIDHYLGKETVQNLMALRFGNTLFEPLWNNASIEHVQILVAETLGVEGRGGYYDTSGALRDMVQNHILQLLCLVAMEPPAAYGRRLGPRREAQGPAQPACRSPKPTPSASTVRGQYRAGAGPDGSVPGYTSEVDNPRNDDGDLRRHQGRNRQLALGRRALLPQDRQAAGGAGVGDRRLLPADPAFDLRRRAPARCSRTSW